MRTNHFQCHLPAFLSEEWKNSSWAGPEGLQLHWAKLVVLKRLACCTTSLRLSGDGAGPQVRQRCPGEGPSTLLASFPVRTLSDKPAPLTPGHSSSLPNFQGSWFLHSTPLEGGRQREEKLRPWSCLLFYFKTIPEIEWEATLGSLFGEEANSHHFEKIAKGRELQVDGWEKWTTQEISDRRLLLPGGLASILSGAISSPKATVMSAG